MPSLSDNLPAIFPIFQYIHVANGFDSVASYVWFPTPALFIFLSLAVSALIYISVGRLNLSKTKFSVPIGGGKQISIEKLIPSAGGNVWWQHFSKFQRCPSDVSSTCASTSETSAERTLRRQMTSIGRFSLRSQTKRNPCIISFFVSMSNKKGRKDMDMNEFEDLWGRRVMDKHERFRSRICAEDDRFFEVVDEDITAYASDTAHPETCEGLKERIEKFLSSPLDVNDRLWEAQFSNGPLGASGAITPEQISRRSLKESHNGETLALFRIHHALADGVSMSVALGDVSDEADRLDEAIMSEVNRRRKKAEQRTVIERVIALVYALVYYYFFNGIKALSLQFWRMMVSANPFDAIVAQSATAAGERSVAWGVIAQVDEMKKVAKANSRTTTINDISVFLVTAAIKRQLAEHCRAAEEAKKQPSQSSFNIPTHVNICIPVHLLGGVLVNPRSGAREPLGNKIGAFVSAIPLTEKRGDKPASGRLEGCSAGLGGLKATPAPLISWRIAKFLSDCNLPDFVSKFAMRNANAQAAAVVSNIKGFPFKIHWNGRRVEQLCAFLPLPPGIPIGIVVQSYDGEMSFSVDADKRAVPNAGHFADWMLEEYSRLKREVGL